jgi:hypothetical protein
MSYFLGLREGFAGAAAFLGLPFPGTLRILSTTEGAYKLVLPAFCLGFIPALRRRAVTAFGSILSISAISLIVKPFIVSISAIIEYFFNFCNMARITTRAISGIRKIIEIILLFSENILAIILRYGYNINIMSYFLGLREGFAGAAFLGRPLPGESFTSSSVLSGYKASFEIGFMPALTILWRAAKYDIPRASATSCIVIPFIFILSALYEETVKSSICDTFYYTVIKEKLKIFSKYFQNGDTFLLT